MRWFFATVAEQIKHQETVETETWETPLVAYTIAALCETRGPLKTVVKEVLKLEEDVSTVVIPTLRESFRRLLPQYKLQEAMETFAENLQLEENFEYLRLAVFHPSRLLRRKEALLNEFHLLLNEKERNIEKYSEIASLSLFIIYFCPFLLMYAILLLGKQWMLPFITVIQLLLAYVAKEKLFSMN